MQSSPMISGMPRRVFVFTVSTARGRSAGEVCRIEPTCLLTIRSSKSPLRASSCIIWPTFFEGHAPEQIGDAFLGGQVGVLVGQIGGGVGHGLLTLFIEALSFNYQLVV